MKLLLEKLSRYWQFRFLAVGAGVVLVVYAVVMPVHSNESADSTILPVSAAPLVLTADPIRGKASTMAEAGEDGSVSKATPTSSGNLWLGENRAVVDQLNLAAQAYQETDLPRDFSESVRGLRLAAEKGDATAQFLLGHVYQLGLGVSKDMTETARWYARAAQSRTASPAAVSSQPAPKDFAQAFDVYRNAAEQGNPAAELYLGLAYDVGQDLPRSAIQAARWYRKAAAQGSYSAATNLGVLYYNGDGVPKDSVEAALWFDKAAARGSASAQYSLGRMYAKGDGVPQNYAKAAAWLEKAASQGNAPAQVLLSAMYASGEGVPGNTPMAYMWINLASATEEQARISREQIEKVIPAAQIAQGQKLTHDWLSERPRSQP